jgi:hypothetical protein
MTCFLLLSRHSHVGTEENYVKTCSIYETRLFFFYELLPQIPNLVAEQLALAFLQFFKVLGTGLNPLACYPD